MNFRCNCNGLQNFLIYFYFTNEQAQQLQHIQYVEMDLKDTNVLSKHKALIIDRKSGHTIRIQWCIGVGAL